MTDGASAAPVGVSRERCAAKLIPRLDNDENYNTWKEDLKIWAAICGISKSDQALHVHLTLTGRARIASSEIGLTGLNKDDGMDTLITKLDALFLPDKERRQFLAFNNLYNLRRQDGCPVKNFIADFEHMYYKFSQENMVLPDAVMSYILLSSCNLSENHVHLVMSALNNVTYKDMKAIIMRVFGSDVKQGPTSSNDSDAEIKTEQTFVSEQETALFNNTRGYQRSNRGRGGRNSGRWRSRAHARGGHNASNRRSNPVDQYGEISRCRICDSKFHWASNCPHSYEHADKIADKDTDETVQLSLFVGFADGDEKSSKLDNLTQEAENSALLDTGCSKTVCGEKWLSVYYKSLSDYQQSKIREEKSDSSFTFGSGQCFQSKKRVTLPCYIGGMAVEITTDVVECQIPLLLSSKSLSKAQATWYFKDNILAIGSKKVKLYQAKSGHSLLPLTL